jgi:hypothetical protein
MKQVVDLQKARLGMAVKRGYRNWESRFGESFGLETNPAQITLKTLSYLAEGREKSTFYLIDLIMNLKNMGSGFEFDALGAKDKMTVMDRYLFLLDRIRFEYMKRLGWLEAYPGEESTLVEMIIDFEELAPRLKADTAALSRNHPLYDTFCTMRIFEREELIRKLIPKALKKIQDSSTTL